MALYIVIVVIMFPTTTTFITISICKKYGDVELFSNFIPSVISNSVMILLWSDD